MNTLSLSGDNLAAWRDHIAAMQETEWLLSLAIVANKTAVVISAPFWLVARLVGIPLLLLGVMTGGAIHYPFRLMLWPAFGTVLWTSGLWGAVLFARPVLLVVGPLSVAVTMVLASLFPEEPDIRDTKTNLCELWPLSRRRLAWVREYGTSDYP